MIDVRSATEYLGWAATAVFVGSYFCTRANLLKRAQMIGAAMWMVYGVLIGASPVIVANVLVFGAAAWTSRAAVRSGGLGIRDRGLGISRSDTAAP
jgi:hypothetical protein